VFPLETVQFIDALKTGVDHIDKQHQSLVDIINYLMENRELGSSPETISFVLAEMAKYVYVHFREEEKFMQDNYFAGLALHRLSHESFEDKVLEFQKLYDNGDTEILDDILDYLTSWLVYHIQGDDASMVKEVLVNRE
jgi:hemerythrin